MERRRRCFGSKIGILRGRIDTFSRTLCRCRAERDSRWKFTGITLPITRAIRHIRPCASPGAKNQKMRWAASALLPWRMRKRISRCSTQTWGNGVVRWRATACDLIPPRRERLPKSWRNRWKVDDDVERRAFSCLVIWSAIWLAAPAAAQPAAGVSRKHLADYDAELRLPTGRVDTAAMVRRLHELGVSTYYWLIAHAGTDWDDLQLFLPAAAQAHIDVWVYLVPPSESA